MSSTILSRRLIPLPMAACPCSSKQGSSVFSSLPPSSFNSTRMATSTVSSFGFGSAILSPVVSRSRTSKILSAISSSEKKEAVVEAEETLETETVEEETEGTDVETEEKPLRKPIIKVGDIMGILNKRAIEASEKERPVPDIRTGDIVEIKLEVPENRRRASIYNGIVISKQNAGIHTTIRIRRIIAGIGVEIVFPVYSPNIKEIKVFNHRKVRRARLYYLRDKLPRLSTFK